MILTHQLKPGEKVRLLSFGAIDSNYRQRLWMLGLTEGAEVTIIRRAPLGCPIEIFVRGVYFSIRKQEAALLEWEYIQ